MTDGIVVSPTAASVSFIVAGINEATVIGDPTKTAVTEDVNINFSNNLTTSGTISVSDIDHGESCFQTTVASIVGNLGSLTLAVDGSYTYTVANSSVQYLNTGDTKIDTFTIFSIDGTAKAINFTINSVEDAPLLQYFSNTFYTENAAPISAHPSIVVIDVDNTNLTGATAAITGNFHNAEDSLQFTNQNGIFGSYNSVTGILTLTGTASVANYQAALRSVTYFDNSDNPDTGSRTITFTVNDGTLNSNSVTGTINIFVFNDPSVVTASTSSNTALEQVGKIIDTDLSVSDVDSSTLAGATIKIASRFVSSEDNLNFTDQNGITGSYNSATGVLTLSGISSVANYQTALRSVSYLNSSDIPNTSDRTISFVVNDGGSSNNISNTASVTMHVSALNDAPTITGLSPLSYTENDAATPISAGAVVGDVDSFNFLGGSLTVKFTANGSSDQWSH